MYLYTSKKVFIIRSVRADQYVKTVDVAEFAKAVSDTSYVVLDVRTPASISGTYFSIDVMQLGTGFCGWVSAGKDTTK